MAGNLSTEKDVSKYIEDCLSKSYVTLGITIGVKLQLFEAMISLKKPSTSQDIADACKYKERYVREWLGLMAVGRIVSYIPEGDTYHLEPQFHKALVDNPNVIFAETVPMMCSVYDDLLACFQKDGASGIPYSRYHNFHSWIDKLDAKFYTDSVVVDMLSYIPGFLADAKMGTTVYEFGCGSGFVSRMISKNFPNCIIHASDISEKAIEMCKTMTHGEHSLHYTVRDVQNLPSDWTGQLKYILVVDVIHDLPNPAAALKEIYRVLQPGGYFFMIDIDAPSNLVDKLNISSMPTLFGVSLFHCMPVSLAIEGGIGLGTIWGIEKATAMLKHAGFIETHTHHLKIPSINIIYVSKKGEQEC